jgi:hypothetical protein
MAEQTTFPEEHVSPPLVYQRVSGFAIASLLFAIVFTVYLAVSAFVGVRDRTPVLLYPATQLLGIVGAALGVIALWAIGGSQGTLAGRKIALAGLWLSVVTVLGYWAYYGATYFAVNQQADAFVTNWLHKLAKEDSLGSAFLDTQDPAQRSKLNPNDVTTINLKFQSVVGAPRDGIMSKPLDRFRTMDYARVMAQAGPSCQIQPREVKEWDFKNGGYRVRRAYQVTSPEGVFDLAITAQGTESRNREFEGRQWQILIGTDTTVTDKSLSQLGNNVANLRLQAARYLDQWGAQLALGNLEIVYARICDLDQQATFKWNIYLRPVLAGWQATAATTDTPWAILPAGLAAIDILSARRALKLEVGSLLHRSKFLKQEDLSADSEETRGLVKAGVENMLGGNSMWPKLMMVVASDTEKVRKTWAYENGVFHLPLEVKFRFTAPGGQSPHFLEVTGIATLETAVDPNSSDHATAWRIGNVELSYAADSSHPQSGTPMPQRGGPGRRKAPSAPGAGG